MQTKRLNHGTNSFGYITWENSRRDTPTSITTTTTTATSSSKWNIFQVMSFTLISTRSELSVKSASCLSMLMKALCWFCLSPRVQSFPLFSFPVAFQSRGCGQCVGVVVHNKHRRTSQARQTRTPSVYLYIISLLFFLRLLLLLFGFLKTRLPPDAYTHTHIHTLAIEK